jgi:dCTP diphosphatase
VSEFEELTVAIRHFAREREWERFHTPKNLAMALSVEVAELVETPEGRSGIEDEIADILPPSLDLSTL